MVGAVPDADHDRIDRLIEMVSGSVVTYTGQEFDEDSETVTILPIDGIVRLPQHPVTAIASVTQYGAVLTSEMYDFTPNGYLTPKYPPGAMSPELWDLPDDGLNDQFPSYDYLEQLGKWQLAPLTITYSHGYPDGESPDDIKLVIAEKVAEKYATSWAAVGGMASEKIEGYEASWRAMAAGQGWNQAHKMTLDAYRRSGFASVRLSH